MREFHHGSGLGQLLKNCQLTKLTEKDYAMLYLISTTKIYAVLKHSIFQMRNASVNFARILAAIFKRVITAGFFYRCPLYYKLGCRANAKYVADMNIVVATKGEHNHPKSAYRKEEYKLKHRVLEVKISIEFGI